MERMAKIACLGIGMLVGVLLWGACSSSVRAQSMPPDGGLTSPLLPGTKVIRVANRVAGNVPTPGVIWTQRVSVLCPAGGVMLTGGCESEYSDESSITMTTTKPEVDSSGTPNGFTCGFNNFYTPEAAHFITAYATCLVTQ